MSSLRPAAKVAEEVADLVGDGHDGERLVAAIEARDREVRAAALEEARLAACENGKSAECVCLSCSDIRALTAKEPTKATP